MSGKWGKVFYSLFTSLVGLFETGVVTDYSNKVQVIKDGVVKTLYPESRRPAYLLRCCKFSIITTYPSTPK